MYVKKILKWVMLLIGVISICSLLIFSLWPSDIPVVNFSIFKFVIIAFIERKGGYTLISCMLIILIIAGALSIKSNRIWLLVLNFAIFVADLIQAVHLFVVDLLDGFINPVVILPSIVDIIVIVLFCLYFIGRIKSIKQNIQDE